MSAIPQEIFKAYDIRGIVGQTISPRIFELIGHAVGSEATARNQTTVVVGRDGRLSSPSLAQALAAGLQKSGIDVIDVGRVTTPMLYFATHQLQTHSGIMVTGSHNPKNENGLKIVLEDESLSADELKALHQRCQTGDVVYGVGSYSQADVRSTYLQCITDGIKLTRPLKITIDCGNGIAGAFAPELFRKLGCEVTELFCEVDGSFPNHHPDPSQPRNLRDLIQALESNDSEIGLAFDGDGDRLGVVSKSGDIIYPDRQMMVFAADLLSRKPGAKIIFDVKSTRHLSSWITRHGGVPIIWKTGYTLLKSKMNDTGALLAGEMSGHIFFKERWYGFDDELYAGARLLEYLSREANITRTLNNLPNALNTPELHMKLDEGENYKLIAQLQERAHFTDPLEIILLDGIRVEYADGFGLARSSNTTPVIVLRFEADNEAALLRIQKDFRKAILEIKPDAELPF